MGKWLAFLPAPAHVPKLHQISQLPSHLRQPSHKTMPFNTPLFPDQLYEQITHLQKRNPPGLLEIHNMHSSLERESEAFCTYYLFRAKSFVFVTFISDIKFLPQFLFCMQLKMTKTI